MGPTRTNTILFYISQVCARGVCAGSTSRPSRESSFGNSTALMTGRSGCPFGESDSQKPSVRRCPGGFRGSVTLLAAGVATGLYQQLSRQDFHLQVP
jgi:hypothetical protein